MLEITRHLHTTPSAFSGSHPVSEPGQRLEDYQTRQGFTKEWADVDSVLPSATGRFYQERATSTTFVSPLYVELIKQKYSMRGDTEVLHFLEMHPFLVQLLLEAYPQMRKYFPLSKISLEVVSDPEEYDREQLVAFVKTDKEPDEVIEALNNFDKTWWLNALKRAQGKLCITVEYE